MTDFIQSFFKGNFRNYFYNKGYIDKQTGEIKQQPHYRCQCETYTYSKENKDQYKIDIHNLKVMPEDFKPWKELLGKDIVVECNVSEINNKRFFTPTDTPINAQKCELRAS